MFQQLVEAKARAIEAVEFAFRHDDGQRVDELEGAEIVLVGVSRTMKTPTMLYLAYRGWFAANVPVVPGVPVVWISAMAAMAKSANGARVRNMMRFMVFVLELVLISNRWSDCRQPFRKGIRT